jgi:NADPH2:quinone reductase
MRYQSRPPICASSFVFGPPEQLVLEERASPAPALRSGRRRVRAAGVNFTDVLATQGRSQLKIQPPLTPGVEVVARSAA